MKYRKEDKARKAKIQEAFDLEVTIFNEGSIRITDGEKRLMLYAKRYYKLDTLKRGKIEDEMKLIADYFNIKYDDKR